MEDKFKVKDSGERENFSSGAVRDTRTGKGRYDLVTPFGLKRLAIVYEKGAEKYSSRNWEKGMNVSRMLDSAERHIEQFKMGLIDEDHLAHACFNLFGIMHFQEVKTDMDDEIHDMPTYILKEES